MNGRLASMLARYQASDVQQRKQALREIVQEIILSGLNRAGFFETAAFYGGTALRVFHGLDRFSEDMDFSLLDPNPDFDWAPYLESAAAECECWNLHFRVEERRKTHKSPINSAFLKGNTRECLITLFSDDRAADAIAPGELLRIKLEVDCNPAPYATFERRFRLLPVPYDVRLYDVPSLFAGKLHAVIARAWRNRTKGRDLYDYVFYRQHNSPVNVRHLGEKLRQTGQIDADCAFDLDTAKSLLYKRFEEIDYEQAKADVLPFIDNNNHVLDLWSAEFFSAITEGLMAVHEPYAAYSRI